MWPALSMPSHSCPSLKACSPPRAYPLYQAWSSATSVPAMAPPIRAPRQTRQLLWHIFGRESGAAACSGPWRRSRMRTTPVRNMGQRTAATAQGIGQRYPRPWRSSWSVARWHMVRMLLTASLVRGMAAPLAAQDPPAVSDDVFRHIHEHMAWVFPTGSPDRFVTTDLANGLQALIDPRGFTLRDATDTAAWSTRLQITDLGRANGPHTPWTTAEPCAHQRRLSWTGTAMDVDYLNTGHGIRQNFLVFTPPAGTGNLMVRMRWESDLVPRPLDGSGVVFTDPGGAPVHAYADLYVFDACDQVLPAWMELDMDTRTLALV